MADYKTPGVYVVEKDAFGSSIVANETAIPVFIGFTEKAVKSNGQELNYMKGSNNVREPILVSSTLEYEKSFGGPDLTGLISVVEVYDSAANKTNYVTTNKKDVSGTIQDYYPGLMYPSVSNFFANGGGSCYIVSIGSYDDFKPSDPSPVDMYFIQKAIEQATTSTLLLPTDLIRYGDANYYNWGTQLADYAGSGDPKKYFCVLDVIQSNPSNPVFNEDDITAYRAAVNTSEPSFIGSYFPYLKSLTSYAYKSDMKGVMLNGYNLGEETIVDYYFSGEGLNATGNALYAFSYSESSSTGKLPVVTLAAAGSGVTKNTISVSNNTMTVTYVSGATAADLNQLWGTMADSYPQWAINFLMDPVAATSTDIVQDGQWVTDSVTGSFPFVITYEEMLASGETTALTKVSCEVAIDTSATETTVEATVGSFKITAKDNQTAAEIVAEYTAGAADGFTLSATDPSDTTLIVAIAAKDVDLKYVAPNNAQIEDVKTFLSTNYINMPPSPFIAGIYSKMDSSSGVWTPPANVAPVGVTGPVVPITSKQQENMNVDASAGKSINAIRSFTGKGTLVWGARTNNGNSQDWRYVNVRRLFNSIEIDISMALEAYVFKPNVHNTWVEVKTMIESYLYTLYTEGAFAGTTPATSYQVLIGLGETMTDEDVLNGYMRASIMVAPVRPAEFIVLTFSQMVGQ